MKKIIVFGNSGSGKSTLALQLKDAWQLAHLDLDSIAWLPQHPPVRKPLEAAHLDITHFVKNNENWVIEGCYADLLALVLDEATEVIFLDLPISQCVENAQKRPWEPHKYASKSAQDENLPMLIEWIGQYEQREDTFSRQAHRELFDRFDGTKSRFTTNKEV
ncbi:shikimate kinase [Alteromonas sp. a30]|uniref:shikimate kinase n=1 Tax=Alteromonas sp. a30 TaxID=2730917 RepID=UPI00227E7300|nr:shikimate kinase [Alteromonas sp. a30]MCY7297143.1 shikimate kinase [Alteromonas sp. a30]